MNEIKVWTIQHRRGKKIDLPQPLEPGELGFCIDTHQLYIGADPSNAPKGIQVYPGNLTLVNSILANNIIRFACSDLAQYNSVVNALVSLQFPNRVPALFCKYVSDSAGTHGYVYLSAKQAADFLLPSPIKTTIEGITGLPTVFSGLVVNSDTLSFSVSSHERANALSSLLNTISRYPVDSYVKVATTADLAAIYSTITMGADEIHDAPYVVDSIPVTTNDRILVKNQSDAKQNGIYYVVAPGLWKRDPLFDEHGDLTTNGVLKSGYSVLCLEGTEMNKIFVLAANGLVENIIVNSDNVYWNVANYDNAIATTKLNVEILTEFSTTIGGSSGSSAAFFLYELLPSLTFADIPGATFNTYDSDMTKLTYSASTELGSNSYSANGEISIVASLGQQAATCTEERTVLKNYTSSQYLDFKVRYDSGTVYLQYRHNFANPVRLKINSLVWSSF